jgi:hypothetical protein
LRSVIWLSLLGARQGTARIFGDFRRGVQAMRDGARSDARGSGEGHYATMTESPLMRLGGKLGPCEPSVPEIYHLHHRPSSFTEEEREALIRYRRDGIEADRFPLSPRL